MGEGEKLWEGWFKKEITRVYDVGSVQKEKSSWCNH